MILLHELATMTRYSCPEHQVYFGYHDVSPYGCNAEVVLATRFPDVRDASPLSRDLEIGYFYRDTPGEFIPAATTKSWCWQQGCRLQWIPLEDGDTPEVFHNCYGGGSYYSVVRDVFSGKILRQYDTAIYALSPDGSLGFSLDFERLQALRPGYGYGGNGSMENLEKAPGDSGIVALDMKSGESARLFSLPDMANHEPEETMDGAWHYFNHLCVNPDGTRLVFFHLWKKEGKRYSRMMTCDLDGSRLHLFRKTSMVSHYWWRNPEEIVCYSGTDEFGFVYAVFRDFHPDPVRDFAPGFFSSDGHCSFSPDGRWFVTDTYPDRHGYQNLMLFNGQRRIDVFRQYCPPAGTVDMRCDLHPRWSPDGGCVLVDSLAEGRRKMMEIDVSRIVGKESGLPVEPPPGEGVNGGGR